MRQEQRLTVSIASDVVRDVMRVLLHEDDYPLIEGVVGRDSVVVFTTPEGRRTYEFSEVRERLLEFVQKMTETRNVTKEEIMRDAEKGAREI